MRSPVETRSGSLIRPIPALLALVAGVGLSSALALASSTEVGQTTPTPTFPVNTPVVQSSTADGSPTYQTPEGVLTSWRFHSRNEPDPGQIKLKVFRRTTALSVYRVIAESDLKTLEPDKAYDFSARIPVEKGDLLGLLAQNEADIGTDMNGTNNDKIGQFGGGDIPVGSTGTTTIDWPQRRVNVAATVESDADKDGFGDDTQDRCPTDATRQDACPVTQQSSQAAADRTAPVETSTAKRVQDVDKLAVFVTLNEAGKVTVRGGVNVPGASKRFAFRSVTRSVPAGVRTKFSLKLRRSAARRVKRGLKRERVVRAKVTLTANDVAGNTTVKKLTIKLKD